MSKPLFSLDNLKEGRSEIQDALKEYNFGEYKQSVLEKNIKQYGNVMDAIFEMDAKVKSLKLENDVLREMIPDSSWDEEI